MDIATGKTAKPKAKELTPAQEFARSGGLKGGKGGKVSRYKKSKGGKGGQEGGYTKGKGGKGGKGKGR